MRFKSDEKGGFLVEVILASGLLLLTLLGSTYWLGRISIGHGSLNHESVALNQARLLLEREISDATHDPVGYLDNLRQPGGGEISAPLSTLPDGRYTLVRTVRSDVYSNALIDLFVEVFWTTESGHEQSVKLFTAIHRR